MENWANSEEVGVEVEEGTRMENWANSEEVGVEVEEGTRMENWANSEEVGVYVESDESLNSKKSEESEINEEIEELESSKECEGEDENDTNEKGDENETDEEDLENEELIAKFKAYEMQVEESQGFDADLFPGFPPGMGGNLPVPCKLDDLYRDDTPWTYRDVFNEIISLAIEDYNRLQATFKIELFEIVKANISHPMTYYITFTAKDVISPFQKEKVFQVMGDKVGTLPAFYAYLKEPNDPSYVVLSPNYANPESEIVYFEED